MVAKKTHHLEHIMWAVFMISRIERQMSRKKKKHPGHTDMLAPMWMISVEREAHK